MSGTVLGARSKVLVLTELSTRDTSDDSAPLLKLLQ